MLNSIKISLCALVLTVSLVGSAWAGCPVGDLNRDCVVDLQDLLVFAEQWLDMDSSREGLVAHWKLDGNADDPVGGNHGTVCGSTEWTIGKIDGALDFGGGVGDYVDCGNDSSLNLTNNFSISAWFKPDNTGLFLLICKGNVPAYSDGGAYTILCVPGGDILAFYVRDSNDTEFRYTSTSVPLNEWTHVVGTFSDGNIKIYKDGDPPVSNTLGTTEINSNTGPFGIGAEGDGETPFSGTIDDVRIYGRVLSEAEVQEIMNLGMPDPYCADLDRDGNVNLSDFTQLAENWHKEGVLIVINEFLASNSSCNADPQGQYDDWLEIYNTGSIAVDIGGMWLEDAANPPWQIPDDRPAETTVDPYGYLLIWADDDIGHTPGLHAGFKLDKDGDQISLYDTDGTTLIDSITFDDQVSDVSYGRYPDASDDWYHMPDPTPLRPNTVGMAATPYFSHPGGAFATNFSLGLTTKSPTAQIYYTTNGDEPTTGSTLYTAPFTVNLTTWVRARAYEPGLVPSPIVSETYIKLDPDVQSFSSNLPIVLIDSFGANIDNADRSHHPISMVFIDTDEIIGRAAITDPADFAGYGGMHVRGSSTATYAKKSYKFETWDENRPDPDPSARYLDKNVSLLGLPAESDWILHGPYSDKTLMQNYQMYTWSRAIGRYAVRTKFVELFRDFDGDGRIEWDGGNGYDTDYHGVYVLMEKIKRSDDRVDIAKLEPYHDSEPEITGGYILKKDWHNLPGFYTAIYNDYLIYEDPRSEELTQAQKDWIEGYFDDFEAVLHGPDFADPVDGYAAYIDIGSFIDHHILVETAKNVDGFVLSTFLFKDRGGKINMGPIWDYNGSLGGADYFCNYDPEGWLHEFTPACTNPCAGELGTFPADNGNAYRWYERLFEDSEFLLKYADRWFELREDLFTTENMHADINYNVAVLTDVGAPDNPVTRNFTRWDIDTKVWPNYWDNCHSDTVYMDYVNWMKYWLGLRLAWMDGAIDTEYGERPPDILLNGSAANQGGHANVGDSVTMTNPNDSGTIYYTLDGADPRLPAAPAPASTVIIPEDADKRVLIPTETDPGDDTWRSDYGFDDGTWISGSGGVGYDRGSGYNSYIDIDVKTPMDEVNTSCYIRVPFTIIGDPTEFDFMTLKMRYDDGFVAYLNGNEVAMRNFTGTPSWDSSATGIHDDSAAVIFENIPVSDHISTLRQGGNILAIHGLNVSTTSSDFLISVELVAGESNPDPGGVSPSAIEYIDPIYLTESASVRARAFSGGGWSALNEATFAVGPVADNLRITEMMYHPQDTNNPDDPNAEFIELKNIGLETTINLSLVRFTEGINFTFPSLELTAGEYVLLVKDQALFASRYTDVPPEVDILGPYEGRLANTGERIRLQDAIGRTIHDFEYSDGWRPITDGDGFSLTIIDPTNDDPNSWGEKDSWRASDYVGGSPGEDNPGVLLNPGAVVINEVMAHSHLAPDWIELYNTTGASINIGGWFLSDNDANLMKYKIEDGMTIDSNSYLVFYEDVHFGDGSNPDIPFALSENGEEACLSSAEGDILTGYREVEDFARLGNRCILGRYFKSSTGNYNFVAMDSNTPWELNAPPKVGPIVISEIMYHPDWPDDGEYNNDEYEYIELHNITDADVNLYDEEGIPWKFTDGIDFTFPDGPDEVTIPASGYLLVVKNPTAFMWRYPSVLLPPERILGPYDGQLNNAGERLEISMPGDVDEGVRQYIRIDRVNYSDGSHPEDCPGGVDHWPTEADGNGESLSRKVPADYGNDPDNWQAASPSPGSSSPP